MAPGLPYWLNVPFRESTTDHGRSRYGPAYGMSIAGVDRVACSISFMQQNLQVCGRLDALTAMERTETKSFWCAHSRPPCGYDARRPRFGAQGPEAGLELSGL